MREFIRKHEAAILICATIVLILAYILGLDLNFLFVYFGAMYLANGIRIVKEGRRGKGIAASIFACLVMVIAILGLVIPESNLAVHEFLDRAVSAMMVWNIIFLIP